MGSILNIALCLLVDKGKILLLERNKEPYRKFLALPGGKIEFGETPVMAALREAHEETGLSCRAAKVLGCATETIEHKATVESEFIMFPVLLEGISGSIQAGHEGELHWLDLARLEQYPKVVPTDRIMLQMFLHGVKEYGTGIVPHFRVERVGEDFRVIGIT